MKVLALILLSLTFSAAYPSKTYSVWHCATDGCGWFTEPPLSAFDWIVNRGDGQPTANIVVLAFLDPIALLQKQTDSQFLNGVPRGITPQIVSYLNGKGIMVIFSIGGESYTQKWDQALSTLSAGATLGRNAAEVANKFGVGIEIDYENENHQTLAALDTFVKTYRGIIPNGNSPQSVLTVDLGAGTGYLTSVSKAASAWLNSSLVNWAHAMVSGGPWGSLSDAAMFWQQHLSGTAWADIPPMNPSQLVVSLYASSGSRNCKFFDGTVLQGAINWVHQKGTRGISFWAAGCPSTPSSCISDCTGIQQGSKVFLS